MKNTSIFSEIQTQIAGRWKAQGAGKWIREGDKSVRQPVRAGKANASEPTKHVKMKARLIEVGTHNAKCIKIKKLEQAHFETPFHFHDMCELNFIMESNGKRIVGDNISNFSPGDLVLMSPNLPHIWYNDPTTLHKDDEKLSSKAIVIHFPINILQNLTDDDALIIKTRKLLKRADRGIWFHSKTLQQVAPRLRNIATKESIFQIVEFLEVLNILIASREYELLASIGYNHSYNQKDTDRLNMIYRYAIEHFDRPITLSEISAVANMSPPAFCNFFRKSTQKTFTRFVNELRIGHACKLLLKSDESIAEISYRCGYQNLTNFNKFFKHIVGKTPSEFKREYAF